MYGQITDGGQYRRNMCGSDLNLAFYKPLLCRKRGHA
jgi:hypothetical protein